MSDVLFIAKRIDLPLSKIVDEVEHALKDPTIYERARRRGVSPRKFALDQVYSKLSLRHKRN